MPASIRSALSEMARVLDNAPPASPVTFPGEVRVTQPWWHGELHDCTEPMREHVLMTYHGAPQRIDWTCGRERRTEFARHGTVTIIPASHAARWDIDGAIEMSHVYLPPARLREELLDRVAVEDETLAGLLTIIARESRASDAPARMLVEQALDLVILQLGRKHAADRVANPMVCRGGLAAWQLRRVTEHMTAMLAEPVTLDELASLVGLSRFHFCSAFHRSTGLPPHKWLRAVRMRKARRLLLETQMPVIDVALSVGYSTAAAFAKAFRAVEGIAPSALRRLS
jgi:AraC family transcriptional regulator